MTPCENCDRDHNPRVISCQEAAAKAARRLELPVSASNPEAAKQCPGCGLRFGKHYLTCKTQRGDL